MTDGPAFDAEAALVQLKRALRDLKLAERGTFFELRGKRVLELKLAGAAIEVRIARKLSNTPEWDRRAVASSTAQRQLQADIQQRLARWEQED